MGVEHPTAVSNQVGDTNISLISHLIIINKISNLQLVG